MSADRRKERTADGGSGSDDRRERKRSQSGEGGSRPSNPRATSVRISHPEDDPLVKVLGEFGWWQFAAELVLFLVNLTYVFQIVVAEFEGSLFGEHWCARPQRLARLSVREWKEISAVFRINSGVYTYDPCFKKDMNYEDLEPSDPKTWKDRGGKVRCTSWEYEDDYSLVSEWNLACTHPSSTTASESVFSIGGLLGSAVSGYIADTRGRRTYIMLSQPINVLISFLIGLSPRFWFYLTFRGIQGFFIAGCYPVLSILSMELTTRKWDSLVGDIFMYSFPVGYVLCSIVAYYVENWRYLHFGMTFLSVSLLLTLWWALPESPRWLWINKKHDQLMDLIAEASRMNRRPVVNHGHLRRVRSTNPMIDDGEELEVKLSDLFKRKKLRNLMIVSCSLLFFVYVAYYGVLLRVNIMFPLDVFQAYLITGTAEILATTLIIILAARDMLNDVLVMFSSCIIAGILFLIGLFFQGKLEEAIARLILARFFMAVLNTSLLLYIAELFPTKLRGLGVGIGNSFNFLALLVTANIFRLEQIKLWLPAFIMAMSAILAGFLILLLPSPLQSRIIPDTIYQIEHADE